ncbi:hypothetical protein G647_03044 [Cladophialophora carrionii CBS 160.54]|uniref:Uncharacterized protein n=1 Tax=Cladophialophora carrionii CBS 160.54 TaxID=1279043 RepID=V9DK00_9EURO|nr:uncharacterized protein G647_03044 [Cladophialophora carrionii CBS 160.54]ETI26267.1 hypothetical protein G647_03044 [Cladophialophora carrionii CBS 160.54]
MYATSVMMITPTIKCSQATKSPLTVFVPSAIATLVVRTN